MESTKSTSIAPRLLLVLRLGLLVIPLFVFGWLVTRDLVVNGVLKVEYDFEHASPFISFLRPQSRLSEFLVDEKGHHYQNVKQEPIYFDVRLPRFFEQAEISLEYQNLDQSVFEVGALADNDKWRFDLKPAENTILDFLFEDKLRWSRVESDGVTLFQRRPHFASINDFLQHLPSQETIATYNYNVPSEFTLPQYVAQSTGIDLVKTLRGTHRMYTYIKDEPLDITFYAQDVNRHTGDDYVSVDIYHGSEVVTSQFFKLDSNISDNARFSEVQELHVQVKDLKPGAYRIDFVTPTDDIFIRRIVSTQDYLVFLNRVYLGDNVAYNDEFRDERLRTTRLYTNANAVSAQTSHVEGLQTILFEDTIMDIRETHKRYFSTTDFGLNEVIIPHNDVLIEARGVFSFSRANFFNPDPTTLANGQPFDTNTINYVITRYSPPQALADGWKRTIITFDPRKYYTVDDELHLVISLPYLESDQKGINIRKIEAKLTAPRLSLRELASRTKRIFYGKR